MKPHINALAALLLFAALCARGEPLVSIQSSAVAPVPDVVARVVSVDARPVAFGAHGTWVLEEDRNRWTRVDWHPDGEVLGAASDGPLAFLLVGARRGGPAGRIEPIPLAGGTPSASTLPALPLPPS